MVVRVGERSRCRPVGRVGEQWWAVPTLRDQTKRRRPLLPRAGAARAPHPGCTFKLSAQGGQFRGFCLGLRLQGVVCGVDLALVAESADCRLGRPDAIPRCHLPIGSCAARADQAGCDGVDHQVGIHPRHQPATCQRFVIPSTFTSLRSSRSILFSYRLLRLPSVPRPAPGVTPLRSTSTAVRTS